MPAKQRQTGRPDIRRCQSKQLQTRRDKLQRGKSGAEGGRKSLLLRRRRKTDNMRALDADNGRRSERRDADRRGGVPLSSVGRWCRSLAHGTLPRNRVHGHKHVIDQSITCANTDKQRVISHDASFDRSLSSTTKQDLLGGGTKPELRGGRSLMRVGLMNCCLV